MVLRMIWSVGLILLVQSIGLFAEGENGSRYVDKSCYPLEKLGSPCERYLTSDSSLGRKKCIFYSHNSNSLTLHHNFNDAGKEFRVSLFRGINKTRSICEGSFNATHIPFAYDNCTVIPSASHVTFHLQSLNEDDTDIYFFCKQVMYPPPYICECDEGTIIHVKEPILQKEVIEITKAPLTFLIILACIAAYSIIITASFLYIWRKKRRMRIQQSEYINVVPRRPKNQKSYIPYADSPVHSCGR
ncbi:T-cell-specific surface glycoprotein CD28 [Leptodactylus fuscus]